MLYVLFLYPFLRKERICLNYCIKNNRNAYIKLDENGTPRTCVKSMRGEFEYSKAKNIDNCLDTTENYFYIKQLNNNSVKEDLFTLLAKFQLLLLMIDKKVFKKEIENVSNLYKVFYTK